MNRYLRCYEGGNYAENQFYQAHLTATGHRMICQPLMQPITTECGQSQYRPDFYCPYCDVWYEVKDSRTGGVGAKHKIEAFRATYPSRTLLVVNPDGSEHHFRERMVIKVPASFSARLAAWRKSNRLTLADVARQLGVSPTLIGNLEDTRFPASVTITTLFKIKMNLPQLFPIDSDQGASAMKPVTVHFRKGKRNPKWYSIRIHSLEFAITYCKALALNGVTMSWIGA